MVRSNRIENRPLSNTHTAVVKESACRIPASHTPNPLQPIAIHAAEGAADLLGPPPVITGEDPDAFLELLDRVRADAKPKGIIEDILVRDFVDLLWDIRRLRRLKASLLQAAAHKGAGKAVLGPLVASWEVDNLADNWALRRPRAIAKVDKVLAAAGLTSDAVMAETLALRLDPIERIERMIASQEGRQGSGAARNRPPSRRAGRGPEGRHQRDRRGRV